MTRILTPADLQTFMQANAIRGEIVYLDTPTPTVEAAAEAVGTQPSRIIKSVLFTIDGAYVLAIAAGTRLIERRAIAAHFGVGRKRVKLADADTVLAITGYPVGTVPPFGHPEPVRSLIDPALFDLNFVYAGGGAHNALVRLHPEDIHRATNGEVLDLHTAP
jgi:prolyl-tRNA editing enzyme YbaK/EbsC (Cys-tRNA(Pro) deacylase)